jgi:hypothetical protein
MKTEQKGKQLNEEQGEIVTIEKKKKYEGMLRVSARMLNRLREDVGWMILVGRIISIKIVSHVYYF